MPELLRSASIELPIQIELPMSPAVRVVGRGTDGQTVCQVEISATGILVSGPRGGNGRKLNWDELVGLVQGS